jgi:menaquinone-dependent protoporphyrinogen IX oxidase
LIAYTTKSGSTAGVAETIGKVLRQDGVAVEVRRIAEVDGLDAYSAVVVGGPMILGWHPDAVTFLQKHQETLSHVPIACFMTALSLTQMPETHHNSFPVFQDPALAKPSKRADRLNFKERYSTVASYLKPVAEKVPHVESLRPVVRPITRRR